MFHYRFDKLYHTYNSYYMRFLSWRQRHVSENTFIIILSLIIGVLAGIAAFFMKSFIHLVQDFVVGLTDNSVNFWYLGMPMLGIFLAAIFVKYIVKDDISHGITKILYAISQHKAIIKLHNTWSSIVASSLTIGFGGSVGPEAPMVLTGAAIGSNLGRYLKLDQKTLMLLVGCGASGAIAGIFKAPIAGVMFTLEVLMLDLTMASISPLIISAVAGAAVAYFLTGDLAIFYTQDFEPFDLSRIPSHIILGVVCGAYHSLVRDGIQKYQQLLDTPTHRGCVARSADIFLPASLWRGIRLYYLSAQGRFRVAFLAIVAIRLPRYALGYNIVYRTYCSYKDFRIGAHKRKRRHGRTLCTIVVRRIAHGISCSFRAPTAWRRSTFYQFRFCRYGRHYERSNARSADRNIPYRRAYGWILAIYDSYDSIGNIVSYNNYFRTTLHICYAFG